MLNRRNGYEYEDLLACGRGEMFGPGNAQLPLPPMLMFDRIAEISETGGPNGKGLIRAELEVRPDLWFFQCHFKDDPVLASFSCPDTSHIDSKDGPRFTRALIDVLIARGVIAP